MLLPTFYTLQQFDVAFFLTRLFNCVFLQSKLIAFIFNIELSNENNTKEENRIWSRYINHFKIPNDYLKIQEIPVCELNNKLKQDIFNYLLSRYKDFDFDSIDLIAKQSDVECAQIIEKTDNLYFEYRTRNHDYGTLMFDIYDNYLYISIQQKSPKYVRLNFLLMYDKKDGLDSDSEVMVGHYSTFNARTFLPVSGIEIFVKNSNDPSVFESMQSRKYTNKDNLDHEEKILFEFSQLKEVQM